MFRLTSLFLGLTMTVGTAAVAEVDAIEPGYKAGGIPITNPAETGYDPDLLVCRDWYKTGTRANRKKVCLSNREWQRVAREGNAVANRIVEDGRAGGITF